MRVALTAALALLAVPALAQDMTVYTGCIRSADGTLYSVAVGNDPKAPCRTRDEKITWNMAGQPGPGPSLPPWVHFDVDCSNGGSINTALAHQAESISISISGECHEEVLVNRDHVTLAGANDQTTLTHEGVPLTVRSARDVSVNNLKITSNTTGVFIDKSQVRLGHCDIANATRGIQVDGLSVVEISESTIHDTALIGIETLSSMLTTYSTHVDGNHGAGIASYASTLHIVGSTANHNGNIGMGLSHNSAGILESSDVSWNTYEGIGAGGSAVSLINSTSTHNGGAGVWGESISVSLSGNTVISDNGTGILVTSSSLAGGGVIKNNVGCGLMMVVGSFAIGAGLRIEQPGGCAISCSNTLAICEPTYVVGQIGGCGDRCPNQY